MWVYKIPHIIGVRDRNPKYLASTNRFLGGLSHSHAYVYSHSPESLCLALDQFCFRIRSKKQFNSVNMWIIQYTHTYSASPYVFSRSCMLPRGCCFLRWCEHNPFVQIVVSGFLPFIAIYVEVHTLFMSVWGHQVYTLFGILLLTFVILLIVTSFVVILLSYFQLTSEE